MSETKSEYMRGVYDSRRREFLRDMSYRELLMLLPEDELERERELISKEAIIDVIIDGCYDKQVNPEVR